MRAKKLVFVSDSSVLGSALLCVAVCTYQGELQVLAGGTGGASSSAMQVVDVSWSSPDPSPEGMALILHCYCVPFPISSSGICLFSAFKDSCAGKGWCFCCARTGKLTNFLFPLQ